MKYKNISDTSLSIPRATGPVSVKPGEEVLGSPRLLAGLIESGHLEPVVESDPAPSLVQEQEPAKRRGRGADSGAGGSDTDHIDSA